MYLTVRGRRTAGAAAPLATALLGTTDRDTLFPLLLLALFLEPLLVLIGIAIALALL